MDNNNKKEMIENAKKVAGKMYSVLIMKVRKS